MNRKHTLTVALAAASLSAFFGWAIPVYAQQAAPAAAPGDVAIPLATATAKTFSLDWKMSAVDRASGVLAEHGHGHADVRKAGEALSFRTDALMVADIMGKPKPTPTRMTTVYDRGSLLVYDSEQDTYVRAPFAQVPNQIIWGDWTIQAVRFGNGLLSPWTVPGPDEVIDGTPVRTYVLSGKPYSTYTGEVEHKNQLIERYYVDSKTNLPIRESRFTKTDDDAPKEIVRLDLTGWKLGSDIAADRFAFDLPKTAKAYVAPKMATRKVPALLAAGSAVPDFTCVGADGAPVKLSDYKGKVVILDFWATWCGPCQHSMPHLEKVYGSLKGRSDVAVLGLCVWDDKGAYEKWRVEHKEKYTFPVAFDPAGKGAGDIARSIFRVGGIPTQFVIGKDGKVVDALVGFSGSDDHRLEDTLAKAGIAIPG